MDNLLWYHLGKQHGGGSGGGGGSEPTVNTVELLKSATFTGFAPDSEFLGAYTCTRLFGENGLEAFQFVVGDNYTVVWDNVVYKVTAKDASAFLPGVILLGNDFGTGLGSNNEPFAIGWFGTGFSLFSLDSLDTHTVRIYQTVLDNTEVRTVGLYATKGSQIIKPSEDGKSMSETIITMPETLIPENIANGVDIGGIIGTLKGGGGGTLPSGIYLKSFPIVKQAQNTSKTHVVINGELYGCFVQDSAITQYDVYKLTAEGYKYVCRMPTARSLGYVSVVIFEGQIHVLGFDTDLHYIWDGAGTWTAMNTLPVKVAAENGFIWRGGMCVRGYNSNTGNYSIFQWNKGDDSWTEIPIANQDPIDSRYFPSFVWNGDLYTCATGYPSALFKVENDAYVKVMDMPTFYAEKAVLRGDELWFANNPTTKEEPALLQKVSLRDGTITPIGEFRTKAGSLIRIGDELHLIETSKGDRDHYTIHVVEGE